MEAPLHHSPVPMPAPTPAPQRQRDAITCASSGALQQQQAPVSVAVTAQTPPLPALPPPPPTVMMPVRGEQWPRCASRDTKFCYYNNYNTAQPRHFCRACRRYWTLGGSLRNVPVGGSTRKRPRPARGPTRALAAAVATTSLSSSAGTATTTTTGTIPSCAPFTLSPVPAPVTAQSGGLLSSLLLGSVPLLQGRLGSDLGHQPAGSTGAGDLLAQLGFGAGPLLWPATASLEGDRAETTTTSKGTGVFPSAATLWQELAAAMPPTGACGGLHQHHGTSHQLLL